MAANRLDPGEVRAHLRTPRQEEHCSTPAGGRSFGYPTDRPHPLAAGTFYLASLGIEFQSGTLLDIAAPCQAPTFVKWFLSASLELPRCAEAASKAHGPRDHATLQGAMTPDPALD